MARAPVLQSLVAAVVSLTLVCMIMYHMSTNIVEPSPIGVTADIACAPAGAPAMLPNQLDANVSLPTLEKDIDLRLPATDSDANCMSHMWHATNPSFLVLPGLGKTYATFRNACFHGKMNF